MKQNLLFTLIILFIASCSKNLPDAELQPVDPESRGGNTIRATTVSTQTKTSIAYGNNDFAAGEISLWSEGDAIAVIFLDENNFPAWTPVTYTIKPGDGGKATAEFTTNSSLPEEGIYKVRAIYPASICYDIKYISFIMQTQNGANTNHIGRFDPMIAELPSVSVDSDGKANIDLTFRHVTSMLRFRLKNETGSAINVNSIAIRSANPANKFHHYVLFSALYSGLLPDFLASETILTCTNSTVAHGSAISDFYMMLPGNTVLDDNADLIISVSFGAEVQEFVIPASSTEFLKTPFAPGMRYYFNLTVTGSNITEYTDGAGLKYELNTTAGTAKLIYGQDASGNVTIPAVVNGCTLLSIENYAFAGSSVTGLTFEAGSQLVTIGGHVFLDCADLTGDITIPAVTYIGQSAFYGTGITGINMTGTTPPILESNAFMGLGVLAIKVPQSAAADYSSVINDKQKGWRHTFSSSIDLAIAPATLPNLGDAAMVTISATL